MCVGISLCSYYRCHAPAFSMRLLGVDGRRIAKISQSLWTKKWKKKADDNVLRTRVSPLWHFHSSLQSRSVRFTHSYCLHVNGQAVQRRTRIVSARFDLYQIAQEHAKDLQNRFRRALLSRKLHRRHFVCFVTPYGVAARVEKYKILQVVPTPVYVYINLPKIAYLALASQCTHTTAISFDWCVVVFAIRAGSCVSIASSVRTSHALYTIRVYHHVCVQIAPAPWYDM